MEIYFDNAATTQVSPRVSEAIVQAMTRFYGNPSSLHHKGYEAEQAIKKARADIAALLKAQEKEILFTSGGTESDNLALIGAAHSRRRAGSHLITTSVEHPAVLRTMAWLENNGYRVTYLPVDANGLVRPQDLQDALTPETTLVSVMYVNNEIGAREPVEELSRIAKAYNPSILIHSDAVQAFGKYRIRPAQEGIDLLSVSAHKLHGPKGAGLLYVRDKVRLEPQLHGGGQQKDLRPGTENVPGIIGLAEAARESYEGRETKNERLRALKERLIQGIRSLEGTHIHGLAGSGSAPHIVSAGFAGIRSETLLHALEERKVYVSSGSACSANHPAVSGVLKAIGSEPQWLDSTIRFSFSDQNTEEEADACLAALRELLPTLRRYRRS